MPFRRSSARSEGLRGATHYIAGSRRMKLRASGLSSLRCLRPGSIINVHPCVIFHSENTRFVHTVLVFVRSCIHAISGQGQVIIRGCLLPSLALITHPCIRRTARSHDGLATANPPARPLAASAVPSTSTSTSTTVAYMYREDAAASASSVISGRSRLRKPTDQFAPAPQVSRRSHTAAQPAVVASPPTQPSLSKAAVLASKSNSSAAVATTSTLRPASCGYPQHTTRSVTRAAIAGAIATTTSAQGSHVTAAAASLPPGLASISAVGAPAADAATAATVDAVMSDSSID